MGSVKDLVVTNPPTPSQMGSGIFRFSDRYSVFDWGEMPDHIKHKGASLAMMSAYFFEQLQKRGVATHYIGLGDNVDHPYSTAEAAEPLNVMQVQLVRVLKPTLIVRDGMIVAYDYSAFQDTKPVNVLLPLECIYRNTLPRGSSVFRRLEKGVLTLEELGLTATPQEGTVLPKPFIDLSTKLEQYDRYLSRPEAQKIAGLTPLEMEIMKCVLLKADAVITEGVERAGLRNDDGKCEFVRDTQGNLMLADALGTLDECRFTYPSGGQRVEVSKEIPRQWYRKNQPGWVAEIDAAKEQAEDWKPLVKTQPKPLPPQLAEMLSYAYQSTADAVLQRSVFSAPPLAEVVREYKRFKELEMA